MTRWGGRKEIGRETGRKKEMGGRRKLTGNETISSQSPLLGGTFSNEVLILKILQPN